MFQYPLHNFLHYQIYEVIDKAINGEPAVYLDLLVSVRSAPALGTDPGRSGSSPPAPLAFA